MYKDNPNWVRFLIQWSFLSLILHWVAACKSAGFYHADEHFQIIEFAYFKLGYRSADTLPLEFQRLLRPWLFPAILTEMTLFLKWLGIQNPLDWAFFYRLFSSFFGWLSTFSLGLCCQKWFRELKWRRWALMALVLLWYIPALHARHSSENLAGSFFFIGLSCLVLLEPKRLSGKLLSIFFGIGALFGLAFQFRYQVGVMIFGVVAWLLVVQRVSFKKVIWLGLGFGIVTLMGLWIDHWGYGQWTLTPWNYLQYNLIQNHVADSDSSPFWDYFRRAFTEAWPVLGLLTLLSFLVAWISNPKHILTWSLLPFFLIHALVGHKELRFLFPMAHVGGVMIILSVQAIYRQLQTGAQSRKSLEGIAQLSTLFRKVFLVLGRHPALWNYLNKGLIFWNGIGLLVLTVNPAWAPIGFYSKLYAFAEKYPGPVYYQDNRIFNFGGAEMEFYRPQQIHFLSLKSYEDLEKILKQKPVWLFYPYTTFDQSTLPSGTSQETLYLLKERCLPLFSTLSSWETRSIEKMNFLFSILAFQPGRITNWTLFECQGVEAHLTRETLFDKSDF